MRAINQVTNAETIELIGGVCPSTVIAIQNDGRNEFYVPFANIFDLAIVGENLKLDKPIPNWCYVYKRVGDSSVFGYAKIERYPK